MKHLILHMANILNTSQMFTKWTFQFTSEDLKYHEIELEGAATVREMQKKTTRYYFSYVRMAIIKKTNKCWQGYGQKGTLVHCRWECRLAQPLCKTVRRFLRKLKIELPYDPGVLLLDIHLKEMKELAWKITCTSIITAALWKKPECPLMDEQIKEQWYLCIHHGVLFSRKKRRKSCHFWQHVWTSRALC